MTLDPKKRAQILKSIKKLVLAHHINVALDGPGGDWARAIPRFRATQAVTSTLAR
jgi:hypothetical protein